MAGGQLRGRARGGRETPDQPGRPRVRRWHALERVRHVNPLIGDVIRLSMPRMKMVVPPLQTPVSMKSPGMPSSKTLRTQDSTLPRRREPIIVNGQAEVERRAFHPRFE